MRWQKGTEQRLTRLDARSIIAAEVALAITLLVGSGLLIRSAVLMQRVDPGFDARGVLTARLLLPQARYSTAEAVTHFYATLRDDAARMPGVQSAALVSVVPMSGSTMVSPILGEGQTVSGEQPSANLRIASDGYFATMGMHLLAGRDLTARDDASSPLVLVVNEALVKKLWPGFRFAMRSASESSVSKRRESTAQNDRRRGE